MHGDKYILLYVQYKFIEADWSWSFYRWKFCKKPICLDETDSSDEDLKLVRIQCN